MKPILIAGNWKMNAGPEEAAVLLAELQKKLETENLAGSRTGTRIVVFPPFVSIPRAVQAVKGTSIEVGAQNAWYEKKGAWTGEVSTSMLREAGCTWLLAGHSERREHFGDTDDIISKKVKKGIEEGLQVILCVGEKLEERKAGQHKNIVKSQLAAATSSLDRNELEQLTIAYEPVWAIGTGETATPGQASEMHRFIRDSMDELHKGKRPDTMLVLYGGSMKPENAKELLRQPGVDGGLIGGASLRADQFYEIIKIADSRTGADGNA